MSKNKVKENNEGKQNKKKKPNILLWIAIVVILIPIAIVVYIVFGTVENSGEPVSGDRFNKDLNPKITEKQIKSLKDSLVFDGVESTNVNLKVATLRVTINTNDDLGADAINAIAEQAYAQIAAQLPIETYFTNKKKVQMYDIEISVYNLIPDGTNPIPQIYYVKSKSAAATEPTTDIVSSPKNPDAANEWLNPNKTPEPATEESAVEG